MILDVILNIKKIIIVYKFEIAFVLRFTPFVYSAKFYFISVHLNLFITLLNFMFLIIYKYILLKLILLMELHPSKLTKSTTNSNLLNLLTRRSAKSMANLNNNWPGKHGPSLANITIHRHN